MDIQFPQHGRKVALIESEVRKIATEMCRRAEINPSKLQVIIIAKKHNEMPRHGVKIYSYDQIGISGYFSTGGFNCDQVRIIEKNEQGRAVSGQLLFTKLESVFGGRIMLMDEEPSAKVGTKTEDHESSEEVPGIQSIDQHTNDEVQGQQVSQETPQRPTTVDPSGKGGNQIGLTKDQSKYHLLVTSIVTRYGDRSPFTFEDFLTNVIEGDMQLIVINRRVQFGPVMKKLANDDFVIRQNKGERGPAVYVITQKAIDFASNTPEPKIDRRRKKILDSDTEAQPMDQETGKIAIKLKELRQIVARKDGIVAQINSIRSLIETNRRDKEALEKRALELDGEIRAREMSIVTLTESLNDPEIVSAQTKLNALLEIIGT